MDAIGLLVEELFPAAASEGTEQGSSRTDRVDFATITRRRAASPERPREGEENTMTIKAKLRPPAGGGGFVVNLEVKDEAGMGKDGDNAVKLEVRIEWDRGDLTASSSDPAGAETRRDAVIWGEQEFVPDVEKRYSATFACTSPGRHQVRCRVVDSDTGQRVDVPDGDEPDVHIDCP